MSLDVYLTVPGHRREAARRIFIREDGRTKEITREEWDRRHPGREPVVLDDDGREGEAYHANITHNLNSMARAADLYDPLWRPEEIGITTARQLVAPLRAGLAQLVADPAAFRELNPPNGWGDYDGLVAFVTDYLAACERHPDADVAASR